MPAAMQYPHGLNSGHSSNTTAQHAGEEPNFKQLLEQSERRILAELRTLKEELMTEVKSGMYRMPPESGMWRGDHFSEVMNRQITSSHSTPTQDSSDDSRRIHRQQPEHGGSLSRSFSTKSLWEPQAPSEVMRGYVSMYGEERGSVVEMTQSAGLLRRFIGQTRRQSILEEGSTCLAAVVASPTFDKVASLLVMSNAVFIGAQVQIRCAYALDLPESWGSTFAVGEVFFLVCFCLEWVLRVSVAGWSFFSCRDDNCRWNWLDTVSVGMQVLDQTWILLVHTAEQLGSTIALARLMRIVRLLRIFRVLRLLHLSDELGMLAQAMTRTLSTVCWALLLMVTTVFAFSVSFTERVWYVREANVHGRLAYFFATVPRTMLTLTEAVLGGVSWDEPAWLLFSEVGWLSGLVFVIFIIIGFFILCNVVTGVFNEGVAKSAEQEAHRQLAVKLQLAIGMEDPSGTPGEAENLVEKITWAEFRDKVLYDDHMRTYFHSLNIDPTEISARKVFEFLDINEDRELTRGELFYGCLKLREPARAVDISLLMHNIAEIEKGLVYLIASTNRLNTKMPQQTKKKL